MEKVELNSWFTFSSWLFQISVLIHKVPTYFSIFRFPFHRFCHFSLLWIFEGSQAGLSNPGLFLRRSTAERCQSWIPNSKHPISFFMIHQIRIFQRFLRLEVSWNLYISIWFLLFLSLFSGLSLLNF